MSIPKIQDWVQGYVGGLSDALNLTNVYTEAGMELEPQMKAYQTMLKIVIDAHVKVFELTHPAEK